MSLRWALDAEPKPALVVLPRAAESLDEAYAAIELWEHYSRKTLDPTQRLAVELMMAQTADGHWAARTTGREMPRQNGKGDEIEVVELWGLTQRAEAILHTVHDAVLLASQAHSRLLSLIEGAPDLRRRKLRAWSGIGQQMIEMRNGGIIWYRTRTKSGGKGLDDVDRLVVDEAQEADEEQLSASAPTLMMNPNPQTNAMGTSGIEGKSAWWWRLRRRALSGDPGDYSYLAHTIEQFADGRIVGCGDPEDRTLWPLANPALFMGRGSGIDFFEEELRNLGPSLFAREHLGVWAPEPGSGSGGNLPNWSACGDEISVIASHHQWAIATSPDRKWSTIGVAGRRADNALHVATHYRRGGTDWVVDEAVKFWDAAKVPVRVWKSGPEASFIALLKERGVGVVEVSTAEVTQACGQLRDGVADGTVRHPILEDGRLSSLDRAVAAAELRAMSDGASVWSQRLSSVEITPLVAVTVALGGVPVEVKRPPRVYSLSKGR
jgi:hypothetical protein